MRRSRVKATCQLHGQLRKIKSGQDAPLHDVLAFHSANEIHAPLIKTIHVSISSGGWAQTWEVLHFASQVQVSLHKSPVNL